MVLNVPLLSSDFSTFAGSTVSVRWINCFSSPWQTVSRHSLNICTLSTFVLALVCFQCFFTVIMPLESLCVILPGNFTFINVLVVSLDKQTTSRSVVVGSCIIAKSFGATGCSYATEYCTFYGTKLQLYCWAYTDFLPRLHA